MIIIKLSEFKVSSQDLDQKRTIYLQNKTNILPVTDLKKSVNQLVLVSSTNHKPLTLNQFNTRTEQIDESLDLYINQPENLRIFGYRLANNRIIFG
ncbi:hypothetical protein ACQW5G_00760 [Fructilactobacillus sp. Tb1]|uniref:hypothetical protein n=1 Tax=Fructilactobacillus sp. Tb1 TaxID=3422304 RepID=UPI003D2D380D